MSQLPSERIKEIMLELGQNGGMWANFVPAILQFLDEQSKEGK